MLNERKLYMVLDESGAMHMKNERFFVIGGYITTTIHKVRSLHKKLEKEIKIKKNIDLKKKIEIKASHLKKFNYTNVLNQIFKCDEIIPICIVIDKNNLINFRADENTAYNLFVKTLLKYLFATKLSLNSYNKIELRLDNRNISIKNKYDLQTYLNIEFGDAYEFNEIFEIKFLNSSDYREIQVADYLSNYNWKKYNKPNHKTLKKVKEKYIFTSKFPFKNFGKN